MHSPAPPLPTRSRALTAAPRAATEADVAGGAGENPTGLGYSKSETTQIYLREDIEINRKLARIWVQRKAWTFRQPVANDFPSNTVSLLENQRVRWQTHILNDAAVEGEKTAGSRSMRITQLLIYVCIGAMCHAFFVDPIFNWHSALTYGWLLGWPLLLAVKLVSLLLTVLTVLVVVLPVLFVIGCVVLMMSAAMIRERK
jgi:hypothetical protein